MTNENQNPDVEAILYFLQSEREMPSLDYLRRLLLSYRDPVQLDAARNYLEAKIERQ